MENSSEQEYTSAIVEDQQPYMKDGSKSNENFSQFDILMIFYPLAFPTTFIWNTFQIFFFCAN